MADTAEPPTTQEEKGKKYKYRRDKPWDNDSIDHWKVDEWKPEDLNGPLLEESSFATLFPQYREKYLREVWPMVTRALDVRSRQQQAGLWQDWLQRTTKAGCGMLSWVLMLKGLLFFLVPWVVPGCGLTSLFWPGLALTLIYDDSHLSRYAFPCFPPPSRPIFALQSEMQSQVRAESY